MKSIYRILFLILLVCACAPTDVSAQAFAVTHKPYMETSGTAAGSPSRAELMSRLRLWVALTFDRSDVIDMTDERTGTMVLKWSAPVPQASKWLTAAMSETCVIDVADGGAFRLRVYAPRVTFATTERADMLNELGMMNAEAEADRNLITGLGQRVYGGAAEWPVDERLDDIVNAYLEQLQATQQFRNDRDRERGRATDEYRAVEHAWRIVHDVRQGVQQYHATLVQSLATGLN